MSHSISRRAFTLVELLVVIAIIGILIALLLPAVQAAREAARRAQCTNNLKQLALAFHNYHDTYKMFPISITGHPNYNWTQKGHSCLTGLLPYIEQQPLYDQIDFDLPIGDGVPGGPNYNVNTAVAQTPVSGFLCPSDDNEDGVMANTRYVPTTLWAVSNYTASGGSLWTRGDAACRHFWPKGRGYPPYDGLLYGNNGFISPNLPPFTPKIINTRMRDIFDGSANSFACGEIVPKWRAHCAWYWFAMFSFVGPPLNYESVYLMNNPGASRESRWMDWTNVYGFYSRHPGGANFGMADGSVRFISDTIDVFTYRMLGNINDGEPIQVP